MRYDFCCQGAIRDVIIPCTIDGMESRIFLALSSDVKGLSVSYAVLDENRQEW